MGGDHSDESYSVDQYRGIPMNSRHLDLVKALHRPFTVSTLPRSRNVVIMGIKNVKSEQGRELFKQQLSSPAGVSTNKTTAPNAHAYQSLLPAPGGFKLHGSTYLDVPVG